MKIYSYKKVWGGGGAENVLAMLKGGTKSFAVVFTQKLEVLVIRKEGGGAQKVSDPRFSDFVGPLSPVINYQFISRVLTDQFKTFFKTF